MRSLPSPSQRKTCNFSPDAVSNKLTHDHDLFHHGSTCLIMNGDTALKKHSALILMLLMVVPIATRGQARPNVVFTVRSNHSGRWSDPNTWSGHRLPKSGDYVQIRTGHSVLFDVESDEPLRMVHVAGTLRFDRSRSTRMAVSLLKIQAGETTTEDGFNCALHETVMAPPLTSSPRPALEIGTAVNPIPVNVTATIRLVYFPGADRETLPAIINCGGRWDVHGAALNRTWVKLRAPVKSGETRMELSEPVSGWKIGDRLIVTASKEVDLQRTFRPGAADGVQGNTEERSLHYIEGATITLDRPLSKDHSGAGPYRCEVANLSRNVVIESADPNGVRGHTMYHLGSSGSLSYAEFRHLGKENVLGKYPIHFHLGGASMRGSSIVGVSVWDSRNRWITIHGTDYLLVRDCVGYWSVGHGFFLEDGTEQYNILDRNLAVQTSPKPGVAGHFRHLQLINSTSHDANVVDLGGGPRNDKLENGVAYYFHDYPSSGHTLKVVSARFPDAMRSGEFKSMDGFTGNDVRAAEVSAVPFPTLLEPVDDLPPATIITDIRRARGGLQVSGISQDNGEITSVTVNGHKARILKQSPGLAEWVITMPPPRDGVLVAAARDIAGNVERSGHRRRFRTEEL